LFRFKTVDNSSGVNGYKRIMDFKDSQVDAGLYVHNGRLDFYPVAEATGIAIAPERYVVVVLTRDSSGIVTGYVNGVQQLSFNDASTQDAVIDTNNTLRFFRDNEFGSNPNEASGGAVARVQMYNEPLSAEEVAASFGGSGPPDFGRCVRLGSKTGGFTNSSCSARSETKAGNYEWRRGVTQAAFTLKAGTATLEGASGSRVVCATEAGSGAYSGSTELANVVLRFSGCESTGHKCTTPGLAEGNLESKKLEGILGWESKSSKKVALDLYPPGKTGPFMEYRCVGGVPIIVSGSLLAPIKAHKMAVTFPMKYKAHKGIQKPQHLEGEANDVLTASLNGEATEQVALTTAATLINEEALEINTAF
jgi:hypothetical protein